MEMQGELPVKPNIMIESPLDGAVIFADSEGAGRRNRQRWIVVGGAAIGMLGGFLTVFFATSPFFLLPLAQEFGWTRAEVTSGTMCGMLGVAAGSTVASGLFGRLGLERTIALSVLCLATGLALLSLLPDNLTFLRLLCFAIGVSGCATTYIGYNSVLNRWFDDDLGIALGIVGAGSGLGFVFAPLISNALIAGFGWRHAYLGLALVALCLGILALFMVSRPKGGVNETGVAGAATGAMEAEGSTFREAVGQWRFWIIVLVVFFSTFATLGAVAHSASVMSDRGLQMSQAAIVMSLGSGLTGLVAKPLIGTLLDRFLTPQLAIVLFVSAAIGLYGWAYATTFPIFFAAAAFTGFAIGAEGNLIPFWVRRYFGTKAFGAIYGTIFGTVTLGGVAGPLAFGYAFDVTGSYAHVMLAASAACVLCAIATPILGKYLFLPKQRFEPSVPAPQRPGEA